MATIFGKSKRFARDIPPLPPTTPHKPPGPPTRLDAHCIARRRIGTLPRPRLHPKRLAPPAIPLHGIRSDSVLWPCGSCAVHDPALHQRRTQQRRGRTLPWVCSRGSQPGPLWREDDPGAHVGTHGRAKANLLCSFLKCSTGQSQCTSPKQGLRTHCYSGRHRTPHPYTTCCS